MKNVNQESEMGKDEFSIYVGVDNGLDGGLCAISAHNGSIIDKMAMPTFQREPKREIDTKKIYKWIMDFNSLSLILIEEPLKHAKSSQAMRSMALSYGKILGMCESHDLNVKPIQVKDWQQSMLGKVPRSQTKIFALRKAKALAPCEDWRKNSRCTIPHDGIVDAYLIAIYGAKQ